MSMNGTAAGSRTRDVEIVRFEKRDNSEMSTSVDNPDTEVDKSAPDPECAASLIGYGEAADGGGRALLCTPYPLTEHEPVSIELDEGSRAALASGKEDTDPLDYQAEPKVHGLVAAVRAYIATDASAAAEAEAMAELGRAVAAKSELNAKSKAKGHFPGSHGYATHPDTVVAQKRIDEAEAAIKAAKQSAELRAEQIKVTFNPADTSFTVEAEYINHTGRTASVAISLPRTEGLTLNDVDVDIHSYTNKSEYQPIKKAQENFKKACAAKDKSASLQAMDKQSHSVTVKIPAWKRSTAGGLLDRFPTTFTARFKLSCDDVEGKALLLPTKPGQPTHEASDFAVQLPAQDERRAVPCSLTILQDPGTRTLALPSRAAAKLDAARRGVPTYWITPPEDVEPGARGRNGCLAHVQLDAPGRQPPCFRFRFVNESGADCDFVTAALQSATIKSDVASAKVLCFAPTSEDECVALVELAGPQCRADVSNAPGKVKHIVAVVDQSGSMGACVPCGCEQEQPPEGVRGGRAGDEEADRPAARVRGGQDHQQERHVRADDHRLPLLRARRVRARARRLRLRRERRGARAGGGGPVQPHGHGRHAVRLVGGRGAQGREGRRARGARAADRRRAVGRGSVHAGVHGAQGRR